MTGKSISRKEFHDGFPTLRQFFLKTDQMSKEELKARDELHQYWCEKKQDGTGHRVLWNGRLTELHVATLAILQRPELDRAKRICMRFNGDKGCEKAGCGYEHKCLFCGCDDRDHCGFQKGLEKERHRFSKQWGQDPLDPHQPGFGETDKDLQASLRRLAKDPPQKNQKKKPQTSETGSATSTGGQFSAFLSDDENSQAEPGDAEDTWPDAQKVEADEVLPDFLRSTEELVASEGPAEVSPNPLSSLEQGSPAQPGLSKCYLLGFVCSLENSGSPTLENSIKDTNLVMSGEKRVDIKTLAAKALKKSPEELRIVYSELLRVAVVYPLKGHRANILAMRFLAAGDPKLQRWLVKGDACFIASKDKEEEKSHVFKPDWAKFDEGIEADRKRFDSDPWCQEQISKMLKRQEVDFPEGPGHMLFIPADDEPWEWLETKGPSGYEEIGKEATEIFLNRGSSFRPLSCLGDDSSDEEQWGKKDVVSCFDQQLLHYSFTKGKMLAAITCKWEILPPQKRAKLNVRAALIIGKLYGLSSLKRNYLRRLKGDAILCLVSPKKELMPRQVWASSELDCDFTQFLESLETVSDGDEMVKAIVMLEEMKTWSFAWLDYGGNYAETIRKLEEMAQPEDWMMRIDDDDSESKLPYLESYLQFKFAFSLHRSKETKEECGIGFRKEGKVLIFATGLLRRRDLQPIRGVFECNSNFREENVWQPPKFDSRYTFKKWTTLPEETSKPVDPVDLLTDECMNAYLTAQHSPGNELKLHELKSFDPYAVVETPDRCLDHITQKRERFDSDNNQQNLKRPNGWDMDNDDRLREQVQKQLEKVCAWCRTDRNIPIMTVFGDFSYQWLVPLPNPSQEDGKLSENPTLVAVLQCLRKDQKDKPCYVLRTVITLDMALMQARLCGKLHQRWTVSRRQAVELEKLAASIQDIPTNDPSVKAAVQNAKKCLKEYKECIVRVLPSAGSMEDAAPLSVKGRLQMSANRDTSAEGSVSEEEMEPTDVDEGHGTSESDGPLNFMVAYNLQNIKLSPNKKKPGGLSIFNWPAHLQEDAVDVVHGFFESLGLDTTEEPRIMDQQPNVEGVQVLVTLRDCHCPVQQVCHRVEALQSKLTARSWKWKLK